MRDTEVTKTIYVVHHYRWRISQQCSGMFFFVKTCLADCCDYSCENNRNDFVGKDSPVSLRIVLNWYTVCYGFYSIFNIAAGSYFRAYIHHSELSGIFNDVIELPIRSDLFELLCHALWYKQRYLMPEGINARVSRYYICWHSITIVCCTFVQQLEICN